MRTNPAPSQSRPQDPPGWRLAFAVWDAIRQDGWRPILKLTLLIMVVVAGVVLLGAVAGPWPLATGLAGVGGATIRRGFSRPAGVAGASVRPGGDSRR